jgi:hypothetical protein
VGGMRNLATIIARDVLAPLVGATAIVWIWGRPSLIEGVWTALAVIFGTFVGRFLFRNRGPKKTS